MVATKSFQTVILKKRIWTWIFVCHFVMLFESLTLKMKRNYFSIFFIFFFKIEFYFKFCVVLCNAIEKSHSKNEEKCMRFRFMYAHRNLRDAGFIGLKDWVSVTFQYRMGCKEEDAIVRSIAVSEVSEALVCLPSFIMSSWFLLTKFETWYPILLFTGFPHIWW